MNYHSVWYIALVAASSFLFLYTYSKKRNQPVFLLLLAAIGFGYIIEGAIYNFLHSYVYYPHFITSNPTYDSNLGAIASNAFVLPVIAVFLATFRKNWRWSLFFSLMLIGIEWLFIEISIYKHNWWRNEFTFFGLLFVYFPIIKLLDRWLLNKQEGIRHFLLLFLIVSPILGTIHMLPLMFFSNRYYDLGWYDNVFQDTNAFAAIYYICSGLTITALAKWKIRYRWLKFIFLIISLFSITRFLLFTGILHIFVWWDPYLYITFPAIVLILAEKVSKILGKRSEFPSEK
ncbi:hypothetical protein [Robertmurraya sp. P23]|uniref:hypothetical protein n=1 Tax=Robertmurraya sp. P23 TaxID=3436931 RepID=UPI003D963E4E